MVGSRATSESNNGKGNEIVFLRFAIPVLTVGAGPMRSRLRSGRSWTNLSLLFITAVTVSALHGGLLSGLIAERALAASPRRSPSCPPKNSFSLSDDDVFRVTAYVVVAIFISWLSGARRRLEEGFRKPRSPLNSGCGSGRPRWRRRTESYRTRWRSARA